MNGSVSRHKVRDSSPSRAIVFWDFDGCLPPANATGHGIVESLRSTLGPVCSGISQVKVFLDLARGRKQHGQLLAELQSSAAQLIDCPREDRRDTADRALIVDIMATCMDRPPPLMLVLISQDPSLSQTIAVLRNRRYEACLLQPADADASSLEHQFAHSMAWSVQPSTSQASASIGLALAQPPARRLLPALDTVETPVSSWLATRSAKSRTTHRSAVELPIDTTDTSLDTSTATSLINGATQTTLLTAPTPSATPDLATDTSSTPIEPSPSKLVELQPLPKKLAKAFLGNKLLLVRLARSVAELNEQRQAGLLPLTLVSRRFRDIVEAEAYRMLKIDAVPTLLRLGRGDRSRLLSYVTTLELDLPVRMRVHYAGQGLTVSAQDDAVVKLMQWCSSTLTTLEVVRGNWSVKTSLPHALPPPPALRLGLASLPRLTHLVITTAPSLVTSSELPFAWLFIDPPYGLKPLVKLRTLRIAHLVGRPVPLYGLQLPLPPLVAKPVDSVAEPRWGNGVVVAPKTEPGVILPSLDTLYLSKPRLAADELERLLLATPVSTAWHLVDCDMPPSIVLGGVTQHFSNPRPRTRSTTLVVHVSFGESYEGTARAAWREVKVVEMAKRLCAQHNVELRVIGL